MDKIKEYFDNPAISQSDLIALSKSPYIFKQKKDNRDTYTSEALELGSAVDCLLTDRDNWEKRFHVLTANIPTGQMKEYVEILYKFTKEIFTENNILQSILKDYIFLTIEKKAYNLVGFKRDTL